MGFGSETPMGMRYGSLRTKMSVLDGNWSKMSSRSQSCWYLEESLFRKRRGGTKISGNSRPWVEWKEEVYKYMGGLK